MSTKGVNILHQEHKEWANEVRHWKTEIHFFSSILQKIQSKTTDETELKTISELINTLKHNRRFLNEILETIEIHELFMKDMLTTTLNQQKQPWFGDHEKTRERMANYRVQFNKLKKKIIRVTEKKITDY